MPKPTSSERELDTENRETGRDDDECRAREHDHRDTQKDDRTADHCDDKTSRPYICDRQNLAHCSTRIVFLCRSTKEFLDQFRDLTRALVMHHMTALFDRRNRQLAKLRSEMSRIGVIRESLRNIG